MSNQSIMSYKLLLSTTEDDNSRELVYQNLDVTASTPCKGLESSTSWMLQNSSNYYQIDSLTLKGDSEVKNAISKPKNIENRKTKMRKVLLLKDFKACRSRGHKVFSQSDQELMCKSGLRNDCTRPKYVVMKRDPKLRPLEETVIRKAKRRERTVVRKKQQASCSTRKSQKQEKAEKMTYCRPVRNFVNEDYEAKAAERNNRLQNIVQKLIEVRQIEKQRETWNNFINELKTKHGLNSVQTNENELIDDYGSARFNAPPAISRPVKYYYIEDMYPHSSTLIEQEIKSNIYDYSKPTLNNSSLFYGVNPYLCYPNISVGGETSKWTNRTCDINFCPETNWLDKKTLRHKKRMTEYVPSEVSVLQRDSYNDLNTNSEENRNGEGRKSRYRQTTDRIASRKTTCKNGMAQNPMTTYWPAHVIRIEAVKNNAERRQNTKKTKTKRNNASDSNHVSDYNYKQEQIQSRFTKRFDCTETRKTQNRDGNSHNTLESIENKLELLIQGLSDLLQEIKPKYELTNDTYENKVSRQNSRENIYCEDCIENDVALRLDTTKDIIKQRILKQTTMKSDISKVFCENSNCSIKPDMVQYDNLDEEYRKICKCKVTFHIPDLCKTCNTKLEEGYNRHKLYDDAKQCDRCSVHEETFSKEYDPRRRDKDMSNEEHVKCRYQSRNSRCQHYKNALVEENKKRRWPDDTQNREFCRLNNKQTFEEEYEKRRNYNGLQNVETGSENNIRCNKHTCLSKTCNKRKIYDEVLQRNDEINLKIRADSKESCDKLCTPCRSRYYKDIQEHNVYAEELPLSLDRVPLKPKTNSERKRELVDNLPNRHNFIPSSGRQKSRESRRDNNISERNLAFSERKRPSNIEHKCDCFRDMFKNIRQQHNPIERRHETEEKNQNPNDEQISLKGGIPEFDTGRQSCHSQTEYKKPEPPLITGTLSRSGPNAHVNCEMQEFTKQIWEPETQCNKNDIKIDISDVRFTTDRETKICEDVETEHERDCSPILPRAVEYEDTTDKDFECGSVSDEESKNSQIDNTTSENQVPNVSRRSSPKTDDEMEYGFKKGGQYMCAVVENECSPFCHRYKNSRIDKIIIEEMDKSDQAKRDIEDILNGEISNTCALSFEFDVPTKDRATEVTNSLSAAIPYENELHTYDTECELIATVAVNTDPLSFLALLRISADTIRNLLGQINLDRLYSSLANIRHMSIPRPLPLSNLASLKIINRDIPGFICNICGSALSSSSELSLHVMDHRKDIHRDCCVCRHLLDLRKRRHAGLFTCVYCGQCFTRAYCCELHQHVCARKKGLKHDVTESLSILS